MVQTPHTFETCVSHILVLNVELVVVGERSLRTAGVPGGSRFKVGNNLPLVFWGKPEVHGEQTVRF